MVHFLVSILGGLVLTWKHASAVTLDSNSTTTMTPTSTTDHLMTSNCTASCLVSVPTAFTLDWVPFKDSTTITAATIRIIVNKENNTTRTTTILNKLPEGVEPIPRNSDGTRTTQWVGHDKITTTMAYPSVSTSLDSTTVRWNGVLFTKGACTKSQGAVTLPPPPPFPINTLKSDSADPKGDLFHASWRPYHLWDGLFPYLSEHLSNEGFFTQCGYTMRAPLQAVKSVAFLTDTVTEYEAGTQTKTTVALTMTHPSAEPSVPRPPPYPPQPAAPQPAAPQQSAPRQAHLVPEVGYIPALVSLIASLGAASRTFAAPPPSAQSAPPVPGPAAPLSSVTIPGSFAPIVPQQSPGSLPRPLQFVSLTPAQSSALANSIPLPVVTAGGNPLTLPGVSLIHTTILQIASSTGADGVAVASTATIEMSMAVGPAGAPVITFYGSAEGALPSLSAVTYTLGSASRSVAWVFVGSSGVTDAMMLPTSAEQSQTAPTTQGGRPSASSPSSPMFTGATVKNAESGKWAWLWSTSILILGAALVP